ncbi:hypothetical protein HX021_16565 [Sphingobacterium sp. N143]|uniref:hypothetical protein n=1 Tax=Sphingobacterium sp. N143 TaxID=2746727 RepID=UPI0025777F1E|nr:hypothetical protein [Sphingobacterium sp. N143]MDM1295905.1 hypothetical protein [Sphingobacterium sp. N143]
MMYRFLKLFTLLILFFSCKHTETYEGTSDDEVTLAFDEVKQSSIKRDISYLPRWQDRIEFEGSYYIPLNTDKRIYSFTPDSVKYSLAGKIWLKANKQGDVWNFTKLTVLPNDIQNSKGSGLFIYEDWQTGALSYEGYIEDKLFSPRAYKVNLRMTAYGKKAMNNPDIPCQTVPYEVCSGDYPYTSCTTSYETIGNCNGGSGGGGDTGHYGGGGTGSGNHGGGGGSTPPIIPTEKPSEEDKEIIDSLQGYPCAQEVLKKLPNLENRISNWLNTVFKNSIENNITFRVSTKLDSKVDAVWNNNNAIGSTQTISLNADMLSKASQEYIAATMFHEALHGYLFLEKKRLEAEGKASQFGILYPGFSEVSINGQPRFVKKHQDFGTQLNDLAAAIRTFAPTLSEYDAMALAKGGVVSDMSSVEKSANYNHREGNAGTRCTTK